MTSQSSSYSRGKINASGNHHPQQHQVRSYISPSEERKEYSMTAQSSTYSPAQVNTNGNHYSHHPHERFQNHPDLADYDCTPIPLHHAIWMPYQPATVDDSRNHLMHPNQSTPFDTAPSYNPPVPSHYAPPFYHAHGYQQSPPTALHYRREVNYAPTGNNFERTFNVIQSSPEFPLRMQSPTPPLTLPPSSPVPSPPPSPSSLIESNTGLIESSSITSKDVLCGRGAGANTHPGNVKFRTLIAEYQPLYLFNKPLFKTNIAKRIVAEITGNGGRFLKLSDQSSPNGKKNLWFNIGFKAAREKTCQALRERAASTFDIRDGESEVDQSRTVVACETIEVNDDDVLMGRGGVTNGHPGNQKFRELVRRRQVEYLAAPKLRKAGIATLVMEEVFTGGGRFLMDKKGRWVEISKEKARAKTSQALREKAPELQTIVDAAQELVAKRKEGLSSESTSDQVAEAPSVCM